MFRTVDGHIKKAIEADLPLVITVTPSTFLGEDVLELIQFAKGYGVPVKVSHSVFAPREETGRSTQRDDLPMDLQIRIDRLLNTMNGIEIKEIDEDKLPPYGSSKHECSECGFICAGGRSSFFIDWKGTLVPCARMDVIRADALQQGCTAAWDKVSGEAGSWPRVPECEGCVYREVCYNDCAAVMLQYAEPGKQPIELCEQTRYYVRHGIRRIAECD